MCGALTGSVMVMGMKWGRTDPKDQETVANVYEKVRQFWDRFDKEFGNVHCYDLTGFRLEFSEERKKFLETGGREKCATLVEKTAAMLYDFLREI